LSVVIDAALYQPDEQEQPMPVAAAAA